MKSSKTGYVVTTNSISYKTKQFYCDNDRHTGARAIWSYYIRCSHLFKTKKYADYKAKELRQQKRQYPTWWFNIGAIKIQRVSGKNLREIKEYHEGVKENKRYKIRREIERLKKQLENIK